jgi:hypothetical protein
MEAAMSMSEMGRNQVAYRTSDVQAPFNVSDTLDAQLKSVYEMNNRLAGVLGRLRGHEPEPIKGNPEREQQVTIRSRMEMLTHMQLMLDQQVEELGQLI